MVLDRSVKGVVLLPLYNYYIKVYYVVIQFLTSFTKKQMEKLRQLSKDTGLSIADIIRRAIDEYMEKRGIE